ncbi:4276_t:CDS:2 [Gigaspora margarita]|uniref:4276_t:CDS:1 n=1 Tax=Gigaspora margarita TaxID=4874 RepID=A0ABN7UZ93_GIGMA|nr:4276_t:CDS:2 [Gigaspora margarita]
MAMKHIDHIRFIIQPYDGVTGRWGGYCHHEDILFAPWHRPYMLLIEYQMTKEGQNPTDKPNYKILNETYNPFTPASYPTIRYPNSDYEDQKDILNQYMSVYAPKVFKPRLYQMSHMSNNLHSKFLSK